MKVVICYSGQYRTIQNFDWKENHKFITRHADHILYTTWDTESHAPSEFIKFTEPTIEYNPFDIKEYAKRWPARAKSYRNAEVRHHITKQIIAHELAVNALTEQYDVVIRMRYDTILGNHNWKSFIEQSYNENNVIGFGGWTGVLDKNPSNLNRFIKPDESNQGKKTEASLCDFMVIHPAHKIKGAIDLDKQHKLFPGNKGWYQVLVEPYEEKHINWAGGCMLARHVIKNEKMRK